MYEVQGGGRFGPEMLLIGGGVMQYVATRISVTVLGRPDGASPGGLALGQWLPILATTLAALALRQPMMAVALIFGSSVASLSLVLGMTTYVNPVRHLPSERRIWPLVLPVALFLLVAGFKGHLYWYHAVMLLVMGGTYLALWLEKPVTETDSAPKRDALTPVSRRPLVFAILLVGLGAGLSVEGASRSAARTLSPELIASTILSPLLLLPALGAGTLIAQQDHSERVVTSLCGLALLNLCLLLPIVILVEFAIGIKNANPKPMAFPLITWRLDTLILLVLGFAMVPLALGRWFYGRAEAVVLVVLYAAYLVAETALSVGLLR